MLGLVMMMSINYPKTDHVLSECLCTQVVGSHLLWISCLAQSESVCLKYVSNSRMHMHRAWDMCSTEL